MSGGAESGGQGELAKRVEALLGHPVEALLPLAPGLGTRRFYRVRLAPGGPVPSAIARLDAPEDPRRRPRGVAPEPPLEPLRTWLAEAGLPVPASLGRDPEAGLELLEDGGERSLLDVVREGDPARRRALYAEAAGWIPRLQGLREDPSRIPAFGRRLDRPLIQYKAERLLDWGVPGLAGRPARPAEREAVHRAFRAVARACEEAPARLAHRDYKAENLLCPPGRPAGAELLWIDFQGAFLAPPEYDLVCLLLDAQAALPEAEVAPLVAAIGPRLPDAPDPATLGRRFDLLGVSRGAKDLSVFVYAARSRGDARYRAWLRPALTMLRRRAAAAARHTPEMADLAALLHELPEDACGR